MKQFYLLALLLASFIFISYAANIPPNEDPKLGEELTKNGIELLNKASNSEKENELPYYVQEFGVRGLNYDIDRRSKRPFIWCDDFNLEKCGGRSVAECTKPTKCFPTHTSHKLACMAVFLYNATTTFDNNTLHESTPTLKGCWNQYESELQECKSEDLCAVDTRRTHLKDRFAKFCCCRTHNCNRNLTLQFSAEESPDTTASPLPEREIPWLPNFFFTREVFYATIVVLLLLCICLMVLIYYWIRRQQRDKENKLDGKLIGDGAFNPLKQCHSNVALLGSRTSDLNRISLIELTSRGRFGEVYKAKLDELMLAVKIFPASDLDSWINEQDIYAIKALRSHKNIVDFVAAYQHEKKFWLVTVFHEQGSLYDYLKSNTLALRDAVIMVAGMLNGLAFLHEEKITEPNVKPTIVHRDFKSKNVLVKNDLTTCIADFGLALKCENGRTSPDENHGQVGTRRYMSPEVLEGATEFSAFAFQQIDVYAAALVLWEILSRTHLPDISEEKGIETYKLPYEKEAGPSPSLGHMRELVVISRFRPEIREGLLHNKITEQIVKTMVEMWDMEPDGRVTSGCARDRLLRLRDAVLMNENPRTTTTSIPDELAVGETTPLLRRKVFA